MKHILAALFIALSIALASSVTTAQSSIGKDSLKGLKGVFVLAEDIGPDVEQNGLTKSQIVTSAELRLRKAGIRVLSEAESFKDDIGTLIITVNTKERNGLYAFFVTVDLSQPVQLIRMPTKRMLAQTYQVVGTIGTVGTDNVRQLRSWIDDMIDTLINDYLAMNPKP